MMGADLMERFRQAGLEAAGQRRHVTILFADLTNYTILTQQLGTEATYEVIQEYIALLAASVYKYQGTVDKFTGDGLMALFGAPIAQEEHAELAVRAALDMQAAVAQLSRKTQQRFKLELGLHVGLNVGSVIVGGVGSNLLMNYTAIGDTVNLAARLMSATAVGVTVSEAVYRQTEVLFNYEPTPPLTLKGYDQPVLAYLCRGIKTRPGSVRGLKGLRAPMIGRETELNQLQRAALATTNQHALQFTLLTAEAGFGKSRLITEFKDSLTPAAFVVLEGRSLTYRRTMSYWIFLDLLRGYLGITPTMDEAEIQQLLKEKVQQVLGAHAEEALPYLEHLLSAKTAEAASDRVRYLDAAQLRQQTFLAMRDLLMAEAHARPLLIILDDLHWADDISLDLLRYLLEALQPTPTQIIAISRPFQGGTLSQIVTWAERQLAGRFSTIQLQQLTTPQSEQLLYRLLTIANLPDALRDQILQRAAGVPLYLEEILRMLMDNHILERQADQWQMRPETDLAALGVPDTLQGLILARFDRLEPTERRALQAASAIGRNFDARLLSAVLRTVDKPTMSLALSHLAERMFITPLLDTPDPEYQFNHVLVSDAIYSTLLKRDREELHGQIGEAMETVYADQLAEHTELLARHYAWSARHGRALHYLILAGQRAAQVYANEQAQRHFQEALALLPLVEHTPVQEAQLCQGLGDVLTLTGDYQAAREQYQIALRAITRERARLHAREQSTLYRNIGQTYERQGDYAQALQHLEQAQTTLAEALTPIPVERARVLHDMGWIHFRRGNLIGAEENLLESLKLVEDSPRYDVIASIYNRLGGVYYQKKDLAKTSYYLQKSLELREEIGDILGAARSYNNRGLIAYQTGDWDQALASYKKNLELQERIGDAEALALSYLNLAILEIDLGDFTSAQAHLEHSLQAAQKTGAVFHIAAAQMHLGRLRLSQREYAQAVGYLRESYQLFEEIGARENLVDVCHLQGEAQLGLGDSAGATGWAQRSLKLALQSGTNQLNTEQHGRVIRLLAKINLLDQQWTQAEINLRHSADIFRTSGSQLEAGRTCIELGRLSAAQGQVAAAQSHWQEAQTIFHALQAKAEEKLATDLLNQLA